MLSDVDVTCSDGLEIRGYIYVTLSDVDVALSDVDVALSDVDVALHAPSPPLRSFAGTGPWDRRKRDYPPRALKQLAAQTQEHRTHYLLRIGRTRRHHLGHQFDQGGSRDDGIEYGRLAVGKAKHLSTHRRARYRYQHLF